jgi:hypothetical protein
MVKATAQKSEKIESQRKTPTKLKKGAVKISKNSAARITKNNESSKSASKSVKSAKSTESPNDTENVEKTKKPMSANLIKALKSKKARGKYDPPNNNTERIGCYLNVNLGKNELRDYIRNTLGYEMGTINSQYPYCGLMELLLLDFVRCTPSYNKKNHNKADLYEITYMNCKSAVLNNNNYSPRIHALAREYDPTRAMGYVNTIYDNGRLRDFISQKAFTNKTGYHIEEPALNFVCYLVKSLMCDVVQTACLMSEFGKNKNIGIKAIVYSCKQHFSGDLGALIEQRLSEIQDEFTTKKEVAGSEEDNEDGDEEDVDEEDVDEEDVDEEDVDEEDGDEEDGDEEDVDEEDGDEEDGE